MDMYIRKEVGHPKSGIRLEAKTTIGSDDPLVR